jgi:hypothetical protein
MRGKERRISHAVSPTASVYHCVIFPLQVVFPAVAKSIKHTSNTNAMAETKIRGIWAHSFLENFLEKESVSFFGFQSPLNHSRVLRGSNGYVSWIFPPLGLGFTYCCIQIHSNYLMGLMFTGPLWMPWVTLIQIERLQVPGKYERRECQRDVARVCINNMLIS